MKVYFSGKVFLLKNNQIIIDVNYTGYLFNVVSTIGFKHNQYQKVYFIKCKSKDYAFSNFRDYVLFSSLVEHATITDSQATKMMRELGTYNLSKAIVNNDLETLIKYFKT
ncbi:hypothetical protein, partial [Mycoplasma sp. CSL7503-lung]|uniref:hypothetical protein n=1 Tax=Mycoplasma sp. CSL7503-lung TaxID=536372 RepID=UPI0021D0A853